MIIKLLYDIFLFCRKMSSQGRTCRGRGSNRGRRNRLVRLEDIGQPRRNPIPPPLAPEDEGANLKPHIGNESHNEVASQENASRASASSRHSQPTPPLAQPAQVDMNLVATVVQAAAKLWQRRSDRDSLGKLFLAFKNLE